MIKQLLHGVQAMPVVKRGRADSCGQELLQPSPSKSPPAVSQRLLLATVISCVSAWPRREKPPLGSEGPDYANTLPRVYSIICRVLTGFNFQTYRTKFSVPTLDKCINDFKHCWADRCKAESGVAQTLVGKFVQCRGKVWLMCTCNWKLHF